MKDPALQYSSDKRRTKLVRDQTKAPCGDEKMLEGTRESLQAPERRWRHQGHAIGR
jgi:hypothetical protein